MMKNARLFFTMIAVGVLTLEVSFADEQPAQPSRQEASGNHASNDRPADQERSNQASGKENQTDGKHSKSKDDGHASEKSGQADLKHKAILPHRHDHDGPKQVTTSHEDAGGKRADNPQNNPPTVHDPHQPGLNQLSTARTDGLVWNKASRQPEQPAKLPIGSGTTAPLRSVVHERTVTAASIGGLAASSARHSTAVINGAGIKRKP